MSALILAMFPLVPPPPVDWANADVVANPFLSVPHVAPHPHAAGTVTARLGGWVRVDWGTDTRWVPTALLLTTEQAYALAAYQHAGSRAAGFAWHRAAEWAARRGDAVGVVRLLDRTVLVAPGWSIPVYGRAVVRDKSGDLAGAVRDAAAFATRRPDLYEGHRLLITLLSDAGRHGDAIAAADRAADALPTDAATLALQVQARAVAGDHLTASALAAQMVARFPDDPVPHAARGFVYLQMGAPAEAARGFGTALRLHPGMAGMLANMAEWYADRRRPAEAVTCLDAILVEFPDASPERVRRGDLRLRLNHYNAAEDDFDRVLATDPNNATALRGRVFCRLFRGRYEDALDDLESAVDLDPHHPWLRSALDQLRPVVEHMREADTSRATALTAVVDHLTDRAAVARASNREAR